MPSYRLCYYPMGGRAAPARLMFVIGGVEFVDERLTGEQLEEAFKKEPARFPRETVPTLEVKDDAGNVTVLTQSNAIARYAAAVAGLLPSDALEAAKHDEAVAEIVDAIDGSNGIASSFNLQGEELKEARLKWKDGALKVCLKRLDALASGAATAGFALGGDKPTALDVQIFAFVAGMTSGFVDHIDASVLEGHTNVQRVVKAVPEVPEVKAWLAKNPAM